MAHGRRKSYCKNKERVRQYAQTIGGKYNNPTVLRLKEKVMQDPGPLTLQTSLDLISLYEKFYDACDKSRKRQIYIDFYDIYAQNVIEVADVINNAEPVSKFVNLKCAICVNYPPLYQFSKND